MSNCRPIPILAEWLDAPDSLPGRVCQGLIKILKLIKIDLVSGMAGEPKHGKFVPDGIQGLCQQQESLLLHVNYPLACPPGLVVIRQRKRVGSRGARPNELAG